MTNTNTTTKNTLKQGGCRLKEEKSDDLVLSYLIHQGYMGTAKAMVKDAMHVCDKKLPLLGARDQYTNEKDLQQRSGKYYDHEKKPSSLFAYFLDKHRHTLCIDPW